MAAGIILMQRFSLVNAITGVMACIWHMAQG